MRNEHASVILNNVVKLHITRKEEETMTQKKFSTKYLVEMALLVAIILIMAFTPIGYIRTAGLEITHPYLLRNVMFFFHPIFTIFHPINYISMLSSKPRKFRFRR